MTNPAVGLYESGTIDRALGDTLRPGGLELTRRMAELLGMSQGRRVLDVASGKGATVDLLSQEFGCLAVGLDRSRQLASTSAGGGRIVVGDAGTFPFADEAFDAVISECSLSLCPDKERAAMEMKRVLKPGGKLGITDVFLRADLPARFRSEAALAACIAGAMKLDEYVALFERLGLVDVYVEDHTKELKQAAWQIVSTYGTTESFLASSGRSGADEWRQMFKQGKPGYALIVATRQ